LLKIGIVCRRSTTPTTVWRDFRIVSRGALNFILISTYLIDLAVVINGGALLRNTIFPFFISALDALTLCSVVLPCCAHAV
jgi:hypothetical protein